MSGSAHPFLLHVVTGDFECTDSVSPVLAIDKDGTGKRHCGSHLALSFSKGVARQKDWKRRNSLYCPSKGDHLSSCLAMIAARRGKILPR